jgi:NCAIR mutase (PurE)-related protein
MDPNRLRELLEAVREGSASVDGALERMKHMPFDDLGYAQVDHHRGLRLGLPEVVFGEGKTVEQIVGIVTHLLGAEQNILVTRLSAERGAQLVTLVPSLTYDAEARVATAERQPIRQFESEPVAVVTAGTSDLPVAAEALATLRMLGVRAVSVNDVGVAGIHRLFNKLELLSRAPALIVVAGMEGALPSVVGGLVAAPVVAVPTSIGYGTALGGFTALFGMLTACASGVTVVNIDNGFGAAVAVGRMVAARAQPVSTGAA